MSNTQKQIIKTTLLQIFDKIQIQNTEKVGYNSYITLLHQILFNEDNEEVCEEYVLFVLRQISHYIQSLHQQKGFKLLSLFFLASRKLSSPLHLKFMETILDLLKFHYSQLNFPFITKSFEEIVEYIEQTTKGRCRCMKWENIKSLLKSAQVNNRLSEQQVEFLIKTYCRE